MSTDNDNNIQNENVVVKYSVKYVLYAAGIFGIINLLDIFSSNASPLLGPYEFSYTYCISISNPRINYEIYC